MATSPSYAANVLRPLPLWMRKGCADVYSSDAFRHAPRGVGVESPREIPNTIPHEAQWLKVTADQETEVLPLLSPNPACRDRIAPEPLPRQGTDTTLTLENDNM